jgi:DNA-binding transcriptional LysR family regulator
LIAMTIDEIEAFVSIARLGGFARAAEALHRSQPAISRRIEMLEEQLRTSIFERVRGGVLLTAAGRSFLPYAEAALASLKDGTEAVRGLERGEHGLVSVAWSAPWPARGSPASCGSSGGATRRSSWSCGPRTART